MVVKIQNFIFLCSQNILNVLFYNFNRFLLLQNTQATAIGGRVDGHDDTVMGAIP